MGHFGGIPFDYSVLEDSNFGARGIPQSQTEAVLEEWSRELGAEIRRGRTFVGLEQDEDGVTAVVTTPDGGQERLRGLFLVGADGSHSAVRKAAGIDFPGTPGTQLMHLADVTGSPVRPRPFGERLPGGLVQTFPVGENVTRIILSEFNPSLDNHTETPDFAEVAAAWQRVTGEDISGGQVEWVSSFTDASRQAAVYRQGRTLLVGDAAHIHLPVGGQGMSTGIQDAVNLGWKLAATIRGWAPEGLLDTYHAERHPVGVRLLSNTRVQAMAIFGGDESQPLRDLFGELLTYDDVKRHLSGTVSHVDIRYDLGQDVHPLVGRRLPPRTLRTEDGTVRTPDLLRPALGVLITLSDTPDLQTISAAWKDRVTTVVGTLPSPGPFDGLTALLVRPDGYVAWAGDDPAGLTEALGRWFGSPDPA
jgi:bifunctional hydroxylase/dehydrase